MADATFVFDFDSTLVRIETLEALADIALAGHDRTTGEVVQQVSQPATH